MQLLLQILWQSSVAMILFYSFYRLAFANQTRFVANRIFLVGSLIVSLLMALFPIRYTIYMPMVQQTMETFGNLPASDLSLKETAPLSETSAQSIPLWLVIYLAGVLFTAFRLTWQLIKPYRVVRKSAVEKHPGYAVVDSTVFEQPFTLFQWIFIDKNRYNASELDVILTHEKVHIHEKHWIDILMIEVFTVFFWFNPFVWMFERAIKKNHEYLADQGVISRGHTLFHYQRILVNQMMGMQVVSLSNSLSYALGSKRLNMMKQEKSSRKKLFRIVFLLPAVAVMLYAFAEPEYVAADPPQQDELILLDNEFPLKGTVLEFESKKPIAGVSVTLKGTDRKAESNKDGQFTLHVPKDAELNDGNLVFAREGYKASGYQTLWSSDELTSVKGFMTEDQGNTEVPPPPPPPTKNKNIISGTIKDNQGNLLAGAKVLEKDDSKRIVSATITDGNGMFVLKVANEHNTLEFSSPGFEVVKQDIDLDNSEPLSIALNIKDGAGVTVTGKALVENPQNNTAVTNQTSTITVSGKVYDHKGNPLPGVTITANSGKGRILAGTITDINGNFKYDPAPVGTARFTFSCVGFQTEIRSVNSIDNNSITINFKRDVLLIELDANTNTAKTIKPPPPPPPATDIPEPEPKTDGPIFFIVEQMPEYKDGFAGLNSFVQQQLKDKKEEIFFANAKDKEGIVGFTIDAKGKVTNAQTLGGNKAASEVLLKIVNSMPDWKPGKQRGKPVSVDYVLKYTF